VYAFRENTYLVTRQGIPHLAVIFAVRMLSESYVACYPDHASVGGDTLGERGVGADRNVGIGHVSSRGFLPRPQDPQLR
jgi:hypothetical protein